MRGFDPYNNIWNENPQMKIIKKLLVFVFFFSSIFKYRCTWLILIEFTDQGLLIEFFNHIVFFKWLNRTKRVCVKLTALAFTLQMFYLQASGIHLSISCSIMRWPASAPKHRPCQISSADLMCSYLSCSLSLSFHISWRVKTWNWRSV